MIESSRRVTFAQGTEVIQQGDDSARALYTICSGVARVEVNGMAIAHLGPGSLLGEMAFLDRSPASASVIAHTELGVDVIDSAHLQTLLASVPGFATRFYVSLATLISGRLRTASQVASRSHSARAGDRGQVSFAAITECPSAILDELDGVCAELAEEARQARSVSAAASAHTDLNDRVASACDRLHALLTRASADYPEQAEIICGHVFRLTFPYLMASRINDHAYNKPYGYAGDGHLLDLLHDAGPVGHGAFGTAVDRWVLARPIFRALCRRGAWLLQSLNELTETWQGRTPVPVAYLANGNSRDLLALHDHPRALDVTCLEMDPHTLQDTVQRLQEHTGQVRISLVHSNTLTLGRGRDNTFLHRQKVIIGADVLNRYEDDDDAVSLLDWIHERLRPDGAVVLGQLRPDHPDRTYLQHILHWKLRYRDRAAVERLFAASRFKNDSLTVEHHHDGVQMKAICRRLDNQ
jgi:CRP-like cAMP-binding protein